VWDETAGVIEVIWVRAEAEYFCDGGWTEISLPGKSLQIQPVGHAIYSSASAIATVSP
jgi:hypothetical protein